MSICVELGFKEINCGALLYYQEVRRSNLGKGAPVEGRHCRWETSAQETV